MNTDLFSCNCDCGCAAKLSPDSLKGILDRLDLPTSPRLIVGPQTMDDAAIYRMSDDLALVLTVDFFPPVARDPTMYGRIATANALSDVYAMGGAPIAALAIVCFPAQSMGAEVLEAITRGAVEKLKEAGVVLAGGHSIADPQPKFGMAVTGTIRPDAILDNAHAQAGDVLLLTKPIGTGVTIMAAKAGLATVAREEEANRCMATLNASASRLAREHGVRACTDVTGFGLLGHAMQMTRASGVSMRISSSAIPKLDGATEYAAMGLLSRAVYSNRDYVSRSVAFDDGLGLADKDLCFDPQTSGGLLLACPAERSEALLRALKRELMTPCAIIGSVEAKSEAASLAVIP